MTQKPRPPKAAPLSVNDDPAIPDEELGVPRNSKKKKKKKNKNETKSPPPETKPLLPMYKITTIPDKGLGVVAGRLITKGTRIMCENHLVRVPSKWFKTSLETEDEHIRWEVRQITEIKRCVFLTLHNQYPSKGPDARSRWTGIFETNARPCRPGSGQRAVYPTISRINHACVPNAHADWFEAGKTEAVYAIRDIQPGEEITIAYAHHRTSLQRGVELGFKCRCTLCTSSPDIIAASDARRKNIQICAILLDNSALAEAYPHLHIALARKLIATLEEEYGDVVVAESVRVYTRAFELAAYLEDHERVHAFARRACKAAVICLGAKSSEARLAATFIDAAQYHLKYFGSTLFRTLPPESDVEAFEKWLWMLFTPRIDASEWVGTMRIRVAKQYVIWESDDPERQITRLVERDASDDE